MFFNSNKHHHSNSCFFFFKLNKSFLWFNSLHISDALTFILHHSHLYFSWFNRTSLVTSKYSITSIFSQFGIHQDLFFKPLETKNENWTCVCSISHCEVDFVNFYQLVSINLRLLNCRTQLVFSGCLDIDQGVECDWFVVSLCESEQAWVCWILACSRSCIS